MESNQMEISLTIDINTIDTDVNVSYEIYREEPDIGITSPYIEVTNISTESNNKDVRNHLKKYETFVDVAEILEEGGAAYA